jgi:cellulose synthase/poly-beta-1,6-N-acetylglucosamine synthase-like glycosyltransferase
MTPLEAIFWACAACVGYTYVGYPLILAVMAWQRARHNTQARTRESTELPVSVIVAAHNEEASIERRIRELAILVNARAAGGELIVVSDGSTDRTLEIAMAVATELTDTGVGTKICPIRLIDLPSNVGKAIALNQGCLAAAHPVLVFADARQTWARDAVDRLTKNLADPSVGAVSGDLVLESASGVMAGVGLYWRFEKWLRKAESTLFSMVSVTGSISALRRELFRPIPAGTVLDDVYWPLEVVMQGYRVIHEPRALAYDRLPERTRDEFRRKVRTLAGNFQLMTYLPAALLPWRNPVWWQFVSHRVMRLVVPWALLIMIFSNSILTDPPYRVLFIAQIAFWCLGVVSLSPKVAGRSRFASAAGSFLVLNAAAWLSFWVWISGSTSRSWSKVKYGSGSPDLASASPCRHQAVEGS